MNEIRSKITYCSRINKNDNEGVKLREFTDW